MERFWLIIALKEQMMRRKNERLTDSADRVVKDIKQQMGQQIRLRQKLQYYFVQ